MNLAHGEGKLLLKWNRLNWGQNLTFSVFIRSKASLKQWGSYYMGSVCSNVFYVDNDWSYSTLWRKGPKSLTLMGLAPSCKLAAILQRLWERSLVNWGRRISHGWGKGLIMCWFLIVSQIGNRLQLRFSSWVGSEGVFNNSSRRWDPVEGPTKKLPRDRQSVPSPLQPLNMLGSISELYNGTSLALAKAPRCHLPPTPEMLPLGLLPPRTQQ